MEPSTNDKEESLMSQRPFRRVGSVLPKAMLKHFSTRLRHAGIRKDVRVWLGARLLLAFLIGSILLLLYIMIFNPVTNIETLAVSICLFLGGGFLVLVPSYLQLYYRIVDRTTQVEKVLPDFLLLTVSNLRAGMSPFAAFTQAAIPEFGSFHEEVRLGAARTGGKSSLADALNEISTYFDSHLLERTVSLFNKGLRSGGHLARLLTSIAQEVRRIQDLRAELISSTRSYTIFLMFILVLVMPFLLSISTHFVQVFLKINQESVAAGADSSATAGMPVFSGAILITANDMVMISITLIVTSSLFMSILIGVISRGRATYGVKYFPLFACAATLTYLLSKAFIESFLSGFSY
ncbi:type II secretion system F family protein [Candidatus Micrarchaeota archaeon]|nr:type II secretion system F family protein [Candidatus Micrarchaeota archaeon]